MCFRISLECLDYRESTVIPIFCWKNVKNTVPKIVSKFVERPAEYHGKVIQKFVYLSELKKFLLVEMLALLNYFMIIGLH